MAGDGPPRPARRPPTSGPGDTSTPPPRRARARELSGGANSSPPSRVVTGPRIGEGKGRGGLLGIGLGVSGLGVIVFGSPSSRSPRPGADGGPRRGQVGQRADRGWQLPRPAGPADVD